MKIWENTEKGWMYLPCVCGSVAQLCLTLCDPMDCSLPGPSAHGIFQARILEWIVIPFSRGSSRPRGQTRVSCIAGRFFTIWATGEALLHVAGMYIIYGKRIDWSFKNALGISLVVQWLRLLTLNVGGSITGWGTKIPQAAMIKKEKCSPVF